MSVVSEDVIHFDWNVEVGSRGTVKQIAVSGDGSRIAIATSDESVRVLDASTGHSVRSWLAADDQASVVSIGINFDGSWVAAGLTNGHIKIAGNIQKDKFRSVSLTTVKLAEGPVPIVVFSPDDSQIAAVTGDRTLRIWGTKKKINNTPELKGKVAIMHSHSKKIRNVVFSPNGRYIISVSAHREIQITDMTSRKADVMTASSQNDNSPVTVGCSRDSTHLYCVSHHSIRIWDIESGTMKYLGQHTLPHLPDGGSLTTPHLAFSEDGRILLVAREKDTLFLESDSLLEVRDPRPHPLVTWISVTFGSDQVQFVVQPPITLTDGRIRIKSWIMRTAFDLEGPHEAPIDLAEWIDPEKWPVSSGGFGEVYRSSWKDIDTYVSTPITLAVKVILTGNVPNTEYIERSLKKEIKVWKTLVHDNILPFLGIASGLGQRGLPAPISAWMANGTARDFLIAHPRVNRMEILLGTAQGLLFLHSSSSNKDPIIHGDIKPDNILINDEGKPCLTDFGISRVISDDSFWKTRTKTNAMGTLRYMSPELHVESTTVTVQSDVYAYGITSFEIITSITPFEGMFVVDLVRDICDKNINLRPVRPKSSAVTNELWELWERCWAREATGRPTMAEICEKMTSLCSPFRPLRVLSIDHSYTRLGGFSQYLNALLRHLPSNSKSYEYFDLIAGTGLGGFIALLLGRLRMHVDECLAEYYMLCQLFDRLSKSQNGSEHLFSRKLASHPEVQSHLDDLVVRHTRDGDTDELTNYNHEGCRSLALTGSWKSGQLLSLRTYCTKGRAHIRVKLRTVFHSILTSGWRNDLINPSTLVLAEVKQIFGQHRQIGCFVSCGSANTVKPLKGMRSSMIDKGRLANMEKRAEEVESTHALMRASLGPETYYRFDFQELVNEKVSSKEWERVMAGTDWRIVHAIRELAGEYMARPREDGKARQCAIRLQWTTVVPNGIMNSLNPQFRPWETISR